MANCIISKSFTFEASHVLPKHTGKCARLHGHSWQLEVSIEGPISLETGFVADYSKLKALVDLEIIQRLDHKHLGYGLAQHSGSDTNLFPPLGLHFYPSSENLVVAIGKILQPLVKELGTDVQLYEVALNETCTSKARWKPDAE